jgi:3-hydroxybutyryl-CoA dehydrogenase
VAVTRGIATSDETFQAAWERPLKFGMPPAQTNDYSGFIANRILMSMVNEAIFSLYRGVVSREDIDTRS